MARVHTLKSKAEVVRIVESLPRILTGQERDPYQLHNTFFGAIAFSLFTDISKAFEEKSKGNRDELGLQWPDLKDTTKAYSRFPRKGDLTRGQVENLKSESLGLLSPGEHKQWKAIFAAIFNKEKAKGVADKDAKKRAAQVAWSKLKKKGANTKIEVLGNRDVLILRDTDTLFRSLMPGKLTKHSYRKYNKNQIYTVSKGQVLIGSKVEYADEVTKARPLWAESIEPWIDRALQLGLEVVHNKLLHMIRV